MSKIVPYQPSDRSTTELSNSKIDKLGQCIRSGQIDADSIRQLEVFRSLFYPAYTFVESILTKTLNLKITGRPSKSTVAIVEKLKRESTRLSQIQDIAGCRIVTVSLASQDDICKDICLLLGDVVVDDKRESPNNGYRAVHLIYKREGRPVEIQVRTHLQHVWSEISEKISDVYGHSIKYGQGESWALKFLNDLSVVTTDLERIRHNKLLLKIRKINLGRDKMMVIDSKALNLRERQCLQQLRSLFQSLRPR